MTTVKVLVVQAQAPEKVKGFPPPSGAVVQRRRGRIADHLIQ